MLNPISIRSARSSPAPSLRSAAPSPAPSDHQHASSPSLIGQTNASSPADKLFSTPSLATPAAPHIPTEPVARWLEGTVVFPRSREHFGQQGRGRNNHHHHHHEEPPRPPPIKWDHAERLYAMLKERYIDNDPEALDEVPTFGAPDLRLHEHPLPADKVEGVKRVLIVLGKMCEVDFCPLLVDLVALLSNLLPEAAVYMAVYNMYEHRPYYFVTSHKGHLAAMAVFRDLVTERFPETAAMMSLLGADQEPFLSKLFYRCFVPLLSYHDAVRVLDLYLADGLCFFYRMGMALLKDLKWRLKVMELHTSQQWWEQIQDLTFSPDFDLLEVLGPLMRRYRKRVRHAQLRSAYLHKLATASFAHETLIVREDVQPLVIHANGDSQRPQLLHKRAHLKGLASFLPAHRRHHSLRLLYSSEVHGRSLATLYRLCRRYSPSFIIIEEASTGALVGGYCSGPITPDDRSAIGSGECFVFRLSPHPVWVFRWAADNSRKQHGGDSFQVATADFFAMGLGGDTDHPALMIDASLDNGSSHRSSVYGNLPLCGRGLERFSINRVEVVHVVAPKA